MAILNKAYRRPIIDLTGPDGNAFSLLGKVKSLGKQLGMDNEQIESIRVEMMTGNYENLIAVFDRNFGEYVDLER